MERIRKDDWAGSQPSSNKLLGMGRKTSLELGHLMLVVVESVAWVVWQICRWFSRSKQPEV